MLFTLNFLDDSRSSNSLLKELLLLPKIAEVYFFLKSCNSKPRILVLVDDLIKRGTDSDWFRAVENLIFIQKADLYNEEDNTVARIDPGVRMDAKAVFDQGYLQRMHHNQSMYRCELDVQSIGSTCLNVLSWLGTEF